MSRLVIVFQAALLPASVSGLGVGGSNPLAPLGGLKSVTPCLRNVLFTYSLRPDINQGDVGRSLPSLASTICSRFRSQ